MSRLPALLREAEATGQVLHKSGASRYSQWVLTHQPFPDHPFLKGPDGRQFLPTGEFRRPNDSDWVLTPKWTVVRGEVVNGYVHHIILREVRLKEARNIKEAGK